jgi:adenylosuccinate synthase
LLNEIKGLNERGIDTSKLKISADAHIITSYHVMLDKTIERFLGKSKIGTTGRGIGPAYGDKVSRVGIRVQDLYDESILRKKVEGSLASKNQTLVKVYNRRAVDVDAIVTELLSYADKLKPYLANTSLLLHEALVRGDNVLLEGGQGTLLDVDHGTYPFVTSSNPTAGGAATGSGIGPTKITRVIGIVKAYTTRVGEGPFPTEFFLTKLDVLSGFKEIPVCVAYEIDGKRYDEMPMTQTQFHHAKPIYEMMPGWDEDISNARKFEDLPVNAQKYVEFLEKISGAPMSAIGVGQHRDATISRRDLIN